MSEAAYLSDMLGHAELSLGVSKSYSTVSVVDNDNDVENVPDVEPI